MHRREFLRRASGMGVALSLGPSFWGRAVAAPAHAGESPYGPLLAPDGLGVQVPEGFTARIVATSLQPVPGTTHVWHPFPDGGACFPTDDGGWIYVSNSEAPFPLATPVPPQPIGGVGAIRFGPDGSVVDAYPILTGSSCNCAGGATPWGTWLSCEEWELSPEGAVGGYDAGRVWECWPDGSRAAVHRPALGRFMHEMATADPDRRRLYLSEDLPDGRFYRFTPAVWGDLGAGGTLEAASVAPDGRVTWVPVPDPDLTGGLGPLRRQVPDTTPFDGGEGIVYDDGNVYLTTKGDDRLWVHDVEADTMAVLYDAAEHPAPVLSGVDNILASAAHDLFVAEDGGNMEVCTVTKDLVVAPVVRLTGPQHGVDTGTPIPSVSEVTGLALSPDGNRLYLNSERGGGTGILYEVTGPWRGGTLAAAAPSGPSAPPAPSTPGPVEAPPTTAAAAVAGAGTTPRGGGALARTGPDLDLGWTAAGVAVVGGALWRLRERATPTD